MIEAFELKYGMNYEQFEAYSAKRAQTLMKKPDAALNQAIMLEEDDAFDWKVARDMLESWLNYAQSQPGDPS